MAGPGIAIAPFVLLFIAALGLVAVVAVLSLRGRKRVTQPECGQCGYAVEGLEALRCPECGGDLRAVGIVTPTMTRGLSPKASAIAIAVAWTLLLPLPAVIVTQIAARAISWHYVNTISVKLTSDPGVGVPGVEVLFIGESRTANAGYERAEARVMRPDGSASAALEIDLAALTCRYLEPGAAALGPARNLSAPRVEDWLASVDDAVETGDPILRIQADQIVTLVATIPTSRVATSGEAFHSVNMTTAVNLRRAAWFMPTAFAVCIALWLGGLLLIHHRYRRRLRASGEGAS